MQLRRRPSYPQVTAQEVSEVRSGMFELARGVGSPRWLVDCGWFGRSESKLIGFGFDPLAQLCDRRAQRNVRKADPSSLGVCEHCGEGLEVKNLEATACVVRQTVISQE